MLTFEYNAEPYAVAAVIEDEVFAKPLNEDGRISRRKAVPFSRNMVEHATGRELKEGIRPRMRSKLKETTLSEIRDEPRKAVYAGYEA